MGGGGAKRELFFFFFWIMCVRGGCHRFWITPLLYYTVYEEGQSIFIEKIYQPVEKKTT